MCRLILIVFLIAICLIEVGQPTNDFLRNLLTTTPSSSHISDFRNQRRTDSRAEKPDIFPGFDLLGGDDAPLLSARKRRRQAYSKLIRAFLKNTRDRLETIRDVIKDEHELHFELTEAMDEMTEKSIEMEKNEKLRLLPETGDDENRKFVDSIFSEQKTAEETNENESSASKQYLTSLLHAIGYKRVTTPNPFDEMQKTQESIFSRYVVNPLRNVWQLTRERFNFNTENGESERSDADDEVDDRNQAFVKLFRIDLFGSGKPESENVSPKSEKVIGNETIKNPSENVGMMVEINPLATVNLNGEMESSEQKINEQMDKDVKTEYDEDMGAEHARDGDKRAREAVESTVEQAALAFQDAFLKHSNDSSSRKEKHRMNANLIIGNPFEDDGPNHIQVVPPKHSLKSNESTTVSSEQEADADVVTFDVTGTEEKTHRPTVSAKKSFSERAGILLLEILGTVVGQTWQALRQIPNYFRQHTDDSNIDA